MENRGRKVQAPIAPGTCIALVETALQKAKSEQQDDPATSTGTGLTLDLSNQKIGQIPTEVVIMIKDEVERLALGYNLLFSFDKDFAQCSRLRYLNVRSNHFKEFPMVLCSMNSLEILDISRNKIKELPADFGKLMNLKILSLSYNRINVLPDYLCMMEELKVLKIDHNTILYPPEEVVNFDEESIDMESWLDNLRNHLKENLERRGGSHEQEYSNSSDGENDTDYSNLSRYALRNGKNDKNTASNLQDDIQNGRNPSTDDLAAENQGIVPAIPSKNLQRRFVGTLPSTAGANSSNLGPATMGGTQSAERSRSNSESVAVNRDRAAKRMGYIGQKNVLGTVDEARTVKHHVRGISYDSSMNEAAQRASNIPNNGEITKSLSNNSNGIEDLQPDPYFCRIQETPRPSTEVNMSTGMVETARSILYSIYKAQPTIEFYLSLIKGRNQVLTMGIDRVLPAANLNISSLIQSLYSWEAKDGSSSIEALLNASHTAILTFKHVLNQLQQVVQDAANQMDARYTRTVLLTIFGSLVELQHAWLTLRKYIPPPSNPRPAGVSFPGKPKVPLPSPLNPTALVSQGALKPQDTGFIPATPGTVVFDNPLENPDELLFDKLGFTIVATLQFIALLSDAIKKAVSQQNPNIQQNALQMLRELDKSCNSGSEVAKRLKIRLETIREADWTEKRKFYEDITRFAQSVMNIGEILRRNSPEFGFPKHVLGGFSPVARLTKEVTVFLHSSTFKSLNDSTHGTVPNSAIATSPGGFAAAGVHFQPLSPAPLSAVPSTPLSAVLGPAAQATVPFLAPGMQGGSQLLVGERSNTMQSNIRTMTGISELGFTPSMLSPRR